MNTMLKKIFFLVSIICIAHPSFGQIQSPEEFLPHEYEKQFTAHHLLVDYFEHVANESEYVKLIEYGRTNEQRPLVLAIVTDPGNMERLKEIQLANLARTGLAEDNDQMEDETAIVWLSFSVHGNEAAGSESSMKVLHEIIKDDSKYKEYLKNTVLIMDPSVNPDGYSRYTSWYRNKSGDFIDYNSGAIEHNEPWPGGRTNHYYFDLNRDWAWMTQVESQQRIKIYQEWLPHIHADLHEMGLNSPYYFAPAAQPYHDYITEWQEKFQMRIGKNHAKYFDNEGWLYFTREVFDLFYPSYGDTYPMFNGAIGMTYEQGGSGRAGRGVVRNIGDTLLLADRIERHTTTALSTLEMGSKNAAEIIREFSQYFSTSIQDPLGEYNTYVLKTKGNEASIARLSHFLDQHLIKYTWAEGQQQVNGFNYSDQKEGSFNMERGDMLISAKQAKGVMVQVLFDPNAMLVDSFTYDITAWAIPYSFGIPGIATSADISGHDINPFKKLSPLRSSAYAYSIAWNSNDCVQFISRLHQSNIRMRLTTVPAFYEGDKELDYGNIIITSGDNLSRKDQLHAIISKAAEGLNLDIFQLNTGLSEFGPDLGSSSRSALEQPKILLLGGPSVSSYSFGHTWHYFDRDIAYPTTIIDAEDLTKVELKEYNVIVLPEGRYRNFGESEINEISTWVRDGGKLILIGSANARFADQDGFSLKSRSKEEMEKLVETDQEMNDRLDQYHNRFKRSLANNLPGLVYQIEMDDTHPLGYGMGEKYFSLKTNSLAFPFIENGWNVGFIKDEPTMIGFAGSDIQNRLLNTCTFASQRMGGGQVVYLIDNPLFRGFWEKGKLLFANAVFLVW